MLCTAAVGDDDGAFIDTEMRRCSKADSPCAISALPSTYIPHVPTISQCSAGIPHNAQLLQGLHICVHCLDVLCNATSQFSFIWTKGASNVILKKTISIATHLPSFKAPATMILAERSNMVFKWVTTQLYTTQCLRLSYLVVLMMKSTTTWRREFKRQNPFQNTVSLGDPTITHVGKRSCTQVLGTKNNKFQAQLTSLFQGRYRFYHEIKQSITQHK